MGNDIKQAKQGIQDQLDYTDALLEMLQLARNSQDCSPESLERIEILDAEIALKKEMKKNLEKVVEILSSPDHRNIQQQITLLRTSSEIHRLGKKSPLADNQEKFEKWGDESMFGSDPEKF